MATRGLRASVRMRAYRDVLDRRQRTVLVALLLGASVSAAALGGGAFASHASELGVEASEERPRAQAAAVTVASATARDAETTEPALRVPPAPTHAIELSPQDQSAIDEAIAALRDDSQPRNAMRAGHDLFQLGEKAHPALRTALRSQDEQQRHIAAYLLRTQDAPGDEALCDVSVDALKDVEINGYFRTLIHRPALSSLLWLDHHAAEANGQLLRALQSSNDQQRFFAAVILGRAGEQRQLIRTCTVLIDQLASNNVDGDALYAANALYRLGMSALPQIRLARLHADEQASKMLQLLEENLLDDEARCVRTDAEIEARYHRIGLSSITRNSYDPVRAFPQFGWAPLPRL